MNQAESKSKTGISDFVLGDQLGEGAYSKVVFAKKKDSEDLFAIKIVNKAFIKKEDKIRCVMSERNALLAFKHPLIPKLYYSFQDAENLYFVIEYCSGGDLADMIKLYKGKGENCPIEVVRFYMMEILLALQYIHVEHHAVHRDLKPENILLQSSGHIALTDFGTILFERDVLPEDRVAAVKRGRGYTFCGSSFYLSPEVLNEQVPSYAADLWSIGCVFYQLLTGELLFFEENDYLVFEKIAHFDVNTFAFPASIPPNALDLLKKLLQKRPEARIGAQHYEDLFDHPFLAPLDVTTILTTTSPFIPPARAMPKLLYSPTHSKATSSAELLEEMMLISEQQSLIEPVLLAPIAALEMGKSGDEQRRVLCDGDFQPTRLEQNKPIEIERDSPQDDLYPLDNVNWKDMFRGNREERRKIAFTTVSPPSEVKTEKKGNSDSTNYCEQYLDEEEEVLYNSVLLRGRCFSFYKYYLVLTTKPRLFCLNLHDGKLIFNLSLKEIGNIHYLTDKCFTFENLITRRQYVFRTIAGDVTMWVETIQSMIRYVRGDLL